MSVGLLKLLAFPVTGPLWIAGMLQQTAERQLYDVDAIREQMADLEDQRHQGLIDNETFESEEERLLARLIEARSYHRQQQLDSQE